MDDRLILSFFEDETPVEQDPPLKDFRVLGFERKVHQAPGGGVVQPASTCYHCGQGIMNCVVIENPRTKQVVDVGETCAERVGLDLTELRAMLREKHQDSLREEEANRRREEAQSREQQERDDARIYGVHGTRSRWDAGCTCEDCSASAPHGTIARLRHGRCYCTQCVQVGINKGGYWIAPVTRLFDLDTGEDLNARCVNVRRRGLRWVINDDDSGTASWYPYQPVRRNTLTDKGVIEAEVEYLFTSYRYDGIRHEKPLAPLSAPSVDRWGEPLTVTLALDPTIGTLIEDDSGAPVVRVPTMGM